MGSSRCTGPTLPAASIPPGSDEDQDGGVDLDDRTAAQVRFLVEADRLKSVERANPLVDGSRRENSAEHSWHVALLALVLAERSRPVDLARVVAMALVHDLVEIDAGDTPPWDLAGRATKADRERAAADRLFGLLPDDQAATFRAWWDEFEAGETPEARLARAMDRLSALLLNHASGGILWREHGRTEVVARARNEEVGTWVAGLAPLVGALLDDAAERGWFADP
jgi:putative hydrolase of HD superfamily